MYVSAPDLQVLDARVADGFIAGNVLGDDLEFAGTRGALHFITVTVVRISARTITVRRQHILAGTWKWRGRVCGWVCVSVYCVGPAVDLKNDTEIQGRKSISYVTITKK